MDGIGELIARGRQAGSHRSSSGDGPDGKLYVRSNLPGPGSTGWELQDIPAGSYPKAFTKWVAHIQSGTTASENVVLGVELSAAIEAAYRSAANGAVMPLDSLAQD
ncbi:hypothetical protein KNN17_20245 [Arthrobacter bambusae]|uniref:hypothetical protein n=1 Tax=Arthrobacter bambusae TaxID=1338426 RepID=UPI001F5090E0|nr:hypothetical protein [Arthrobacter bambusae]MCI0143896.1 hypothetical protein [Arthrobacter bambusae]